MSLDITAALEVARAVAGKQRIDITIADFELLLQTYQAVQAKTFDPVVMAKSGSLEPIAAALTRTSSIFDQLLLDKVQGPRVVALLASLKS